MRGSNSRPARTTVAGGGVYCGGGGGTHAGGNAAGPAGCCAGTLAESEMTAMATASARDAATSCLQLRTTVR